METFKQFKGLIYLLIITGLAIFLSLQFKSREEKPVQFDTAYQRISKERNAFEIKTGILEFQVATLTNELNDIKGKEEPIKQYFSGKRQDYGKKTMNETDREFLEVVR